MHMSNEIETWSERQFGSVQVGDMRRVKRVKTIAAAFAANPGVSIPRSFETQYDVKAAYNLFQHPEATPESLQAGHRSLVRQALEHPGVSLLLEDTSELSWKTGRTIEGLGPTGSNQKWHQGFLLHSVLAVHWSGEGIAPGKRPPLKVLGLIDQQYYARKPIPEGENGNGSWHRQGRERESQLWSNAGAHVGRAPDDRTWIRVCDRGADIYEFLRSCQELGHAFVVRAAQNRALVDGGRLFEVARSLSPLGGFSLEKRQRNGHPARTVRLLAASSPVSLRSPKRIGANNGTLPAVDCSVVRVWEPVAPAGEEALEWILLVARPVQDFEQALEAAIQYASRWIIEDFHKALKTGVGAERLQLEDAHRLFAAIAIMSVVALRLVDLRERLRINPLAPAAEAGLEPFELEILQLRLHKHLKTVRDVALAIGRLGGHMNRKADGMPGILTLWHGMTELQALAEGARLGLQLGDLGKA